MSYLSTPEIQATSLRAVRFFDADTFLPDAVNRVETEAPDFNAMLEATLPNSRKNARCAESDFISRQVAEAERRRLQRLEIAASFALCRAEHGGEGEPAENCQQPALTLEDEDQLLIEIIPNN